jgi:hypothetical protein
VSAIDAAVFIYHLVPALRETVVALVKAIQSGDDAEARKAFEAALRAGFVARQRP